MMTMATPRKTSTETNRGTWAETKVALVLTVVRVGELTAVTMLYPYNHASIFRSWVHVNGWHGLADFSDVNKLQLNGWQFVTICTYN